jgi:nicotinamidase-related amidase
MSVLHLCIDMQANYKNAAFSKPAWDDLESATLSLIDRLKYRNIPTVYVHYSKKFTPFTKGVGQFRDTPPATKAVLMDSGKKFALNSALPLTPVSLVAYKTEFSAFRESSIAHWIEKQGFSKIILSGVFEKHKQKKAFETISNVFRRNSAESCCVSATARDFKRAGYDVIIAAEATQCGIEGRKGFLPLEERNKNHERFGVKVTPVKELLSDLDKDFFRFGAPELLFKKYARQIGAC